MITLKKLDNLNKPYKIYLNKDSHVEYEALDQFYDCLSQDYSVKGAVMPDAHLGYGLNIGGVIATKGVIVPAWVGYDIGCGMCAIETSYLKEEIIPYSKEIFNEIYRSIPTGFNHNKKETPWDYKKFQMSEKMEDIFNENGLKQLGTLGSGNHYIEICYDENNKIWINIHSGSRGVGHKTASHYMKLASNSDKAKEGNYPLYVDSKEGIDYITDLNFCLEFALENRKVMIWKVLGIISKIMNDNKSSKFEGLINRNHNHAELRDGLWIHRKGATHAEEGMMGVIPGNMRDGSFIVKGKGNSDSLYSSSHGAGRVMSRKKAKASINLDDFRNQMEGITAKVDHGTLDESPDAYKSIFEVMDMQKDLVEVIHHLKPIINIKG